MSYSDYWLKLSEQVNKVVSLDSKSLDSYYATRKSISDVDYSIDKVVYEKDLNMLSANTFNNAFYTDKEERIFTSDAS